MSNKHPLETILEDLIAALPARGAVKGNIKIEAQAALDKWRSDKVKEVTSSSAIPAPSEKSIEANMTTPTNWKRAEPVNSPGIVRAHPVPRPSIAGQIAGAIAANLTDGLPPGVVQAQRVVAPGVVQDSAISNPVASA